MLTLSEKEKRALEEFRRGGTHGGDGNRTVDELACRGLLQRVGKVEVTLTYDDGTPVIQTRRRDILAARAREHQYRITRKGLWALAHATVIPAYALAA